MIFTKNFRVRVALSGVMLETVLKATRARNIFLVLLAITANSVLGLLLLLAMVVMLTSQVPDACLTDGFSAPKCDKGFLTRVAILFPLLLFISAWLVQTLCVSPFPCLES
jgi:hypothetical protein